MAPSVYVIVLNWNNYPYTLGCLASLEKLDYPNYHIIVVDNGSTDDSVRRIRNAYPSVTLLKIEGNVGFAGGNNVGIRYALEQGADYVWLLNNDTRVDPNALTAMVSVAERDPKAGAVGAVLYYMDEPERVQAWGGGRVSLWWGISRHFTAPVPVERIHYITGASLLIRREALEEVGLLDEGFFMYWEDADFGFRLRKAGWKIAVASSARVWHKESASLGKRNPVMDRYFSASAARFFQHHAPYPVVPILVGFWGRLAKRVIRLDLEGVKESWRGMVSEVRSWLMRRG